ncbi:MAG: hypothetical protein HDR95_07930 [Bacteroides sp.]|nr:hypothetical protein [Bacteroides sp.]
MTARDIISSLKPAEPIGTALATVEASMPVIDVLPRLLDTPDHRIGVSDGEQLLGVIDTESLLAGVARLLPARDDCSVIEVECVPADYSAALLTHAAEDADVHVVGLWTAPSADGRIRVTMRLRCEDPTHVVRNIERYGFDVVETHARVDSAFEMASRRLRELQLYLNV